MNDPYQPPQVELEAEDNRSLSYIGFWARAVASLVDSILMMLVIAPVLYFLYGQAYFLDQAEVFWAADILINYLLPAIAVILFWIYKSATPGKMLIHAKIVDASTGGHPSTAQLIGRYLAYYLSAIPLGLGFFWVAWDRRKQGWHDKLAGTLMVRND